MSYPLPPRYPTPAFRPSPFRPGGPDRLDPLGLHIRDTTDPHKVRDRLVDIGLLRKNGDGSYEPVGGIGPTGPTGATGPAGERGPTGYSVVDPAPSSVSTNPVQNKTLFPLATNWPLSEIRVNNGGVSDVPTGVDAYYDSGSGRLDIGFVNPFPMFAAHAFTLNGTIQDDTTSEYVSDCVVGPIYLGQMPGGIQSQSLVPLKTHLDIAIYPGYGSPISYVIPIAFPEYYRSKNFILARKHRYGHPSSASGEAATVSETVHPLSGYMTLMPVPEELVLNALTCVQIDITCVPEGSAMWPDAEIGFIVDLYMENGRSGSEAWTVAFE